MSAPAASVTPLHRWQPHREALPSPSACYACVARLLCYDLTGSAFTARDVRALFSPGDLYSVVFRVNLPRHIVAVYDALPFSAPLSWCGAPCRLVRVRIGLPVLGAVAPRPFQLLALLPTREIEDVPPLLRLGAEFLHANRASVHLSASPCEGRLIIPY